MVNLEKYKNDGWGLSKKCLQDIFLIVKSYDLKPINVLEFGSGVSTEFFVDLILDGKKINIVSYDDDIQFSTKAKHENLKLIITDLVECYDSDYEKQFIEKKYNPNLFYKLLSDKDTKQKNVFYKIVEEDLPKNIDIMILDGPHGNGRNIAFLVCNGKLKKGSYVVIDDYNHYDFVEKFEKIFDNVELISKSDSGSTNQWELGGNYVIYKIK